MKKISKVGNILLFLMLIVSMFAIPLSIQADEYEPQATSYFSVIPSVTSVEVGDDFYVWVYLDANDPCDTWVCNLLEFNWTSVGLANATGVMEGYWFGLAGFGETGTIYNDDGNIKEPQFMTTGDTITTNQTCFRVNFTTLDCGILHINLTSMSLEGEGNPRTFDTNNATVTIYPQDPASLLATMDNYTQIDLTFTAGVGDDKVTICRSNVSYADITGPSDGVVYNGSTSPQTDTGLDPCTTYFYKAWGWNETTGTHSPTYRQSSTMTDCYTNFTLQNEEPNDGNTTANCTYSKLVSVQVINAEIASFDYWINASNGQTHSASGTSVPTTIGFTMTGLLHNTSYWWNVTVTDGAGDTHSENYSFTTGIGGGAVPTGASFLPTNAQTSVNISNVLFSTTVTDTDGDPVNATYYWQNTTEIGTVEGDSGTALNVTYTGTLDYATIYYWYVVLDDTAGCSGTTKRYPTSGTYYFRTDSASANITKEWSVCANNSILTYINVTNDGETNLSGINITDTIHANLTQVGANVTPTYGDNIWIIDSLNVSEYWRLKLWFNLSGRVANGTSITNTVTAVNATYGISESASPSALTMCCYANKEANITVLDWNTTHVQYYINVTNCGDFYLNNVTVNETYDANMTFVSANYGTNPSFDIGTVNPGATGNLIVNCTTSYEADPADLLINATRHYNNVTYVANEVTEQTESSYLFVGAQTETLRVTYIAELTEVSDIGNSVLNILGILLIIGAIFLIVGMFYKQQYF